MKPENQHEMLSCNNCTDRSCYHSGDDRPTMCSYHKTVRTEKMFGSWNKFSDVKPANGQMCIVAAGPDHHAQIIPMRWYAHDQEFYWHEQAQDLGVDPFPTELASYWMPWPDDPVKGVIVYQGRG